MRSPRLTEPTIHPDALILPGARIYGQVTIAEGVLVLFGAVIRGELDRIDIGAESNIQDNAVLHCDEDIPCLLGKRVTVGHAAVVHGAIVGDRCLIAIGAILLNGSRLGEGAWLGAGSVLAEGAVIPDWTLALGTPARPVRDLTDEEITRADEGVDHYLELREAYREII
jgi:carbonic anhydrase/acetyltransferase-like protein (isoleucine patch superfamily)